MSVVRASTSVVPATAPEPRIGLTGIEKAYRTGKVEHRFTPNRARLAYLDNLKVLLVAAIIAAHGALGYGSNDDAWPYQSVQEVQLSRASDITLALVVIPAALFAMGLFFLLSGLLTPSSVSRKGPPTFARDRLVRLGVPLAVWTLVVWPGAIWAAHRAAGDTHSFRSLFIHSDPLLDAGPMWFVEVLLIYSLAYAVWRYWHHRGSSGRDRAPASNRSTPLTGRTLVALAAAISLATVLVRPLFPLASDQLGQSHLWQWPQFLAMFGLGIVAAQRGWLDPVPDQIRRRCGFAALAGLAMFLIVAATMAAVGVDGDVIFDPGLQWPGLCLAVIEGPLAVGTSLWLLGVAQRRLNRRPGELGHALARSAYGAFLLQGVVLIALMIALRPVGAPAEVKALAVAGLGVAGSFALAWVLVTRTRLGRAI